MNETFLHSNTEQKSITLNDDKAFAMADREGDFRYTDEKEKDNKYEFEGSQNKITLNRIYDTEWICDYHMGLGHFIFFVVILKSSFRWYPFDTQTCQMIFKADANLGEFVELKVGYLKYHGPVDLQQYFIRSSRIMKSNSDSTNEDGSVNVEIVLGRRLLGDDFIYFLKNDNGIFSGTILTVYIPTLLLICISYITVFFKPFFFEAIVAVNLTCMLVRL